MLPDGNAPITGLDRGEVRPLALLAATRRPATARRRAMPEKFLAASSSSEAGPLGWRVAMASMPDEEAEGVDVPEKEGVELLGGAVKKRIAGGVAAGVLVELSDRDEGQDLVTVDAAAGGVEPEQAAYLPPPGTNAVAAGLKLAAVAFRMDVDTARCFSSFSSLVDEVGLRPDKLVASVLTESKLAGSLFSDDGVEEPLSSDEPVESCESTEDDLLGSRVLETFFVREGRAAEPERMTVCRLDASTDGESGSPPSLLGESAPALSPALLLPLVALDASSSSSGNSSPGLDSTRVGPRLGEKSMLSTLASDSLR